MNDAETLKLLKEIMENSKKVTEKNPYLFFGVLLGLARDMWSISHEIKNSNFRLFSINFYTMRNPVRVTIEKKFQDLILEKLREKLNSEKEIRLELILDSVSEVTLECISDNKGRNIVDTNRLKEDLYSKLKDLDEVTKLSVIMSISKAIRNIYEETSFIEDSKKKMVNIYEEFLEKRNWAEVIKALTEIMLKWDKKSSIWRNSL